MIQNTVDRIEKCLPRNNICIVTNRDYVKMIKKQLPKIRNEDIFIEPDNKETAYWRT
jgi:mannose-1-phosphate guanylyltransferase